MAYQPQAQHHPIMEWVRQLMAVPEIVGNTGYNMAVDIANIAATTAEHPRSALDAIFLDQNSVWGPMAGDNFQKLVQNTKGHYEGFDPHIPMSAPSQEIAGKVGDFYTDLARQNLSENFRESAGTYFGDSQVQSALQVLPVAGALAAKPLNALGRTIKNDVSAPGQFQQFGEALMGQAAPKQLSMVNITSTTPAKMAKARAETGQAPDVVKKRLGDIVPIETRLLGGAFQMGKPDGTRWSDDNVTLNKPGPGYRGKKSPEELWDEAVAESSVAAQNAVRETNARMTMDGAEWDQAFKLPYRTQLWYELSGETFHDKLIVPAQLSRTEALQFDDYIGATSAREKPLPNLERSLSVLSQQMQGKPITTDLSNPAAVTKAVARTGHAPSSDLGNKTGNFSDTLAITSGVQGITPPIAVNDVWEAAIIGITDTQLGANQSLHEPMAIFKNKMRDEHNAGLPKGEIPTQSFGVQSRGWVQKRGSETSSDYNEVWDGMIAKLRAAGIKGIGPNGELSRQALMDPGFSRALRPTLKAFEDAPISTIEFGSLLNAAGRETDELLGMAKEQGNQSAIRELGDTYLKPLRNSALRDKTGRKTIPTVYQRVANAITGRNDLLTRIEVGTIENPLDVSGSYEGKLSSNIRVPLRGMDDDQVAGLLAIFGEGLDQGAMAASAFTYPDPSATPTPGLTRTTNAMIHTTNALSEQQLTRVAETLNNIGHDINVKRVANGYVIEVNPQFTDNGPVGASEVAVEMAMRLAGLKADLLTAEHRSLYYEKPEYEGLINDTIKRITDESIQELRVLGVRNPASVLRGSKPTFQKGYRPRGVTGIRNKHQRRISDIATTREEVRQIGQARDDAQAEVNARRGPRLRKKRNAALQHLAGFKPK